MSESSAERLYRRLGESPAARAAARDDAAYVLQVRVTAQLLDVVDEVTDDVTGALVADAIYERLTGDGASEAAQRVREREARMAELARRPPLPLITGPSGWVRR